MPRWNHQNIGRASEAAERVFLHLIDVERHIHSHLALKFKINPTL